MAHNPAIFNASAFFGDSNTQKGQQDPFWNQHPTSLNHSSGFFDGTAAPVDPFMSNTQGYVDGWDEWPEDDEFLGDESALQNHVLGQENLDTPKLIVPNHNESWSSSSSVGSTPNGMDPELNAWNEEETASYAQPSYQNAATYYAHQPDPTAQHVKTYASACQAGMSRTPNHQDLQAPQTSQQTFGAQDEPCIPENTPSVELWSQEPELGSWSPVFNHDNSPFLTSQEEEHSSSSFANEGVFYANDKKVATEGSADSSQQGGTTMAPPLNYWMPSIASKQEVLSSSAHMFADNGGYTPSDLQNTSHQLRDPFQQVGPAKASAQNYWTPTVPSHQEMPSLPAQLFADNGEYPPSDQKEGTEPSADPFQQVGPAAAPALNYWTPVTSHQDVPSSSGPATAPAQDHWTPMLPTQQEMRSQPAQLFASNGEYPVADQKEKLTPSGSFQQVGPVTAPVQDYWTPTIPSQQEMRSSPAQLFGDDGEYPLSDQKEMLPPSGDSFQQVSPATVPAQDYWTPTIPSQQEMQPSPAHQVGPAAAPIGRYWTPSVASQQEVPPLPNQTFTDGGEHLPTGQEQPPGLASDTFQQVGTANAPVQKYCMPTMTSEQDMPSSTTQQLAYSEEYPPTGQQAPTPSTDPFQQVDTTTVPAQNHWASTVTSQQEVLSSAAQLFADNGDYLPIGQEQAPRLPAVPFQQFGMAVASFQEDRTPNVALDQEVPLSAQQSHADHHFGLDNTSQQKAENIYGQEEEQADDAWASLSEKDILQADLWGNLPVIRRVKDAKPPVVECDLDQEETPQHPQSESPFIDHEAEELSQQHEQVPPPFNMEASFNNLSASKQLPEVTSEVVPELGSLGVFYQSDPVVEENQPPLYEEGVVSGHTQPSFQDQQVTGDENLTELQQPLPAPVEESMKDNFPVEPDSPRDALQTAFLQKQLAGKAPAASPRTSLWMNANAVLPTSCVLAPAVIVPPIATPEVLNRDQQPPTDKQQKGQPLPAMPALVPVAGLTSPSQATATFTAQEEPVNMVPNFSNSDQPPFALAEQFNAGINQSSLNTHPPTSTELPVFNSTRQQNTAPEVPNNNTQAASEVSVLPVVTALVQEQKTESSPISLAFNNQTAEAEPDLLPDYSTSAGPLFPFQPPSDSKQFNAGINKSNLNPHPLTSSELPVHNFARQQNSAPEVPNNNPQAASEVSAPQPVTPVEVQRTESSQISLASLLQGGKTRPKKKISQPSASTPSLNTDPGLLQNANNPSVAYNTSNPSSLPSLPLSTADQPHLVPGQSSKDLSQSLDNQSLDSAGRTEELEHSRQRDYSDSHDHPRSPEDPYVLNRRDPYYHEDHRDQYGNRSRQDPYQEQERDYDRPYYDRRDPDGRGYDRRRDFDRRESDYGRRPYDRQYDRRGYDGRDHTWRDSHDNRDSYYAHGYSSRQGRRGYDEHRNSREDLYRGSYHSGRSTPSSDRNSPASYDYSAYASHQYGYPSYTDHQSMDLYQYQYLMYLYQFHPQHYEQYCAQLGYYNMGYTPEQLAQYYGGMYNSAGYTGTEPTEPEETAKSEPERFTPLLYRVQHPLVKFSGGKLLSLIGGEDDESPRCTIASVQMVFSVEEIEVIRLFPGPLSSRYSSRTEVMAYCEKRSAGTGLSGDGVVKSLVWKILANLVKHNGAFVTAELAEIIMENWRNCNSSAQHEFISPEGYPPAEIDSHKHIQVYREMLLAGATKDALEYCMRTGLWGHAMLLASKMDKKVHNDVTNRFTKTMTDFDPIRTVYDHLSGRQPVALLTTDDWQRNLAAMVANPPRQHTQCIKKNMVCLGDTLMSNDQVWEAHLCYLLAGEHFGYPSEEKTKMSMVGIDHRTTMISDRHLPLENLQMMEVLEYAVSLSNEEHHIPVLQSYKFMHLNKLSEAGFTEEALHYAELIGHTIIKHPTNANSTLVKNIREVIDRLNPETQEASEMIEMLDKVLQAKNSPASQISSSVTESESEAEEPLAESSASFFSGYEPSTNTPQHQAEPVEDVQPQLSYTESSMGAPPAHQEPMPADIHQDSWSKSMATGVTQETWSGGMDSQVTQPELPPSMVPQAPEPTPAPAPAPAPQPPFFVPGPPVTEPLPAQMGEEQLGMAEEQPVYGHQWLEGARFEEAKKEPMPLKEPEPPKKAEEKPKSPAKKKEVKRNSPIGGWFSGLLSKVMPRGPNEMILPDDTKKSIYWDEELKRWINTDEDEQDKVPPPPPPTDMQLGAGRPPMMPLGNAATAGATTQGVGGPVSTPFSPPSVPAPGFTQPLAPGGIPAGMATPPAVSKFSRKAYGGGRLAKKYVDVLNPSGQSSNGPAMLPSSLLPTFPGPTSEFNPANLFVPAPVSASDDTTDTLPTAEPVVGNPGSRPSSRNDDEDGGDQQSQHSRSSSVSLTSAEVRSYMMPQVKRVQTDVKELGETEQADSGGKRKLLSRKRHRSCIKEGDSEKYEVPRAKRSCNRRKKETIDACNSIHGGDSADKSPALDGMWLTLVNESTPVRLANYVQTSSKMIKKVVPKVCKKPIKDFENSLMNQVRSLKVLYGKGLLSKEQYKAIRLNLTMTPKKSHRNVSLKFMSGVSLPKLLPYEKLIQFVKSVDIGNVRDIEEDFCSDLDEDEKVHGVHRELEQYLLELAKMYIHIDQQLEEEFLLHFNSEPYHFRVAVGADGAPFGKDDEATAWLISFLNAGLQLRDCISRFSRVTVDETVMGELSESCSKYFNGCALFLGNVTPTVWTIGYAVPYHTGLLYRKFGVGLGINSMQGREAKHVRISQYSKHATLSTRWRLVMRHDYITAVWLRKLEPFKSTYHKCKDFYTPKSIELPQFCYCGLEKPVSLATCNFCSSQLYQSIAASSAAGKLDAYLCSFLSASN